MDIKGVKMTDKILLRGGGYWLFVSLYIIAIVYKSSMPLMSGDDMSIYTQLVQDKSAWHGLAFGNGRFFPLAGWALTLMAYISIDPYALMFINALSVFGIALSFYILAKSLDVPHHYILISFALVALSVGFVKIMTQITFPETTQILFLMLFLLCAYKLFSTQSLIYAIFGLVCANACLYLKEVSFIFIGGFGFFYCAFKIYAKETLSKKELIFSLLCMLCAVLFLVLYMYFTREASSSYAENGVFSPLRTLVVLLLALPFISIALPLMLVYRIYGVLVRKDAINAFWDSILCIAALYVIAYLVLGMASFHYFVPPSVLVCLYGIFFWRTYRERIKKAWITKLSVALMGFIWLTSTFPQGLHYYGQNKIQTYSYNEAMDFLADFLKQSPQKTYKIHFVGFVKGGYNEWMYPHWYSVLPTFYNVRNFEIVDSINGADILVLSNYADIFIDNAFVDSILASHKVLFASDNWGYMPYYNLLSLGAWGLQNAGVKHHLSNKGNIFKLPAQVYVLQTESTQ